MWVPDHALIRLTGGRQTHHHSLTLNEKRSMPKVSYRFSNRLNDMDFDLIHSYLSTQSYWSRGVSRAVQKRAMDHSLNFGVFDDGQHRQVAYGRMVTDQATFAYLADVFVVESHRGRGVGKLLMDYIHRQESLQGLKRKMLATKDAHGLYEQFGYKPLMDPSFYMESVTPSTSVDE